MGGDTAVNIFFEGNNKQNKKIGWREEIDVYHILYIYIITICTFEDVSDLLVRVNVFLEKRLDFFLVVRQLLRRDCDDVL